MAVVTRLSDGFQLRMRTLSPVHVGAGKEKWLTRNLDYFVEDRQIVIVDTDKFMLLLMNSEDAAGVSAYDKFCTLHSKNQQDMDETMTGFLEETDITLPEITKQKLEYTSEPANVIHTLVRDGLGRPILPGSSVKGAIRSAIFHTLHNPKLKKQYEWNTEKKKLGQPEKEVFGDFLKEQLMRFIRPCDVKVPKTEVQNVDLFYVSTNSKRSVIDEVFKNSLSLEVIPAGVDLDFELVLASDEWLAEIKKQENLTNAGLEKKHHLRKDQGVFKPNKFLHNRWGEILPKGGAVQKLFEIINITTRTHLEREINFYEKFPLSPLTRQIIAELEAWKKKTERSTSSCILRLGAGSGFHSMTGEWRFDDHSSTIDSPDDLNQVPFRSGGKHDAPYKTRKWALQGGVYQTLGFVEISLQGAEGDESELVKTDEKQVVGIEIPQIEMAKPKEPPPPKPVEKQMPRPKDFSRLKIEKDKTVLDAEIIRLAKPFPRVRLLIENYPFSDTFADLTGSKNVSLVEGEVVQVLVRQLTKEGKISNVSLCKS
ncbi:MAG: type III-A CRISPR-associated RAMP protein Csm5 [Saprospiraceae bacterium]